MDQNDNHNPEAQLNSENLEASVENDISAESHRNLFLLEFKGRYCRDVNLDTDIGVIYVGYERLKPGYTGDLTGHPFYRLFYMVDGQATLKDPQGTYKIGPGVVYLFHPGELSSCTSEGLKPWEYFYIHFTGSRATELVGRSSLGTKRAIHVSDTEKVRGLFENIFEENMNRKEGSQEICGNYLRVLLLKLAALEAKTTKNPSLAQTNYSRCKKFIDENFQNIRLIKDVADKFDLNPEYMSHMFKKFAGISPYQYLMRLKLNRAAVMLLEDKLLVKQIARSLNFGDPYNFSKSFRKYHGIPPIEYKKQYS